MSRLSHIDEDGAARMVDVGDKPVSERSATARGVLAMAPATRATIEAGNLPKGDVIGPARVAGIMAAKRTADLIPLCHPLPITGVTLDFDWIDTGLQATATVRCAGRTGVEMEALTAVSVALLTLYDMAKAVDKSMILSDIHLIEKRGGASGDWSAG